MKKFLIAVLVFLCSGSAFCQEAEVWHNDLRTKFLNNESVIMEVNLRSFNSKDDNGDGFIQEELGEVKGSFLNAVNRLDELKKLGVNTLHVLPITPVGKLKALGTAGSLYAIADFKSINPELADRNSDLSLYEQAKKFVDEAHKRGIRVIVDVPACGSYDLYLKNPSLFVNSSSGDPVLPSDWTDVRLLSTGTEDKIDINTYNEYKEFVKLMLSLGVDGIRADVAHSKTKIFWKTLIEYSRNKDPEFLWLAESSELWHDPISPYAVFTPYDELLDAGFDGYYGTFAGLKNWSLAKDFYNNIALSLNESKRLNKRPIGSFTTHDEVSPILVNGEKFSEMIIWLNATLPINSYFVDGFQTGDTYMYKNGNKIASSSSTDDNIYFTHRGQIDIFNFSRKPEGNYSNLKNEFILANDVKKKLLPVLNNGTFSPLKTGNDKIFAYYFEFENNTILTVGNLNFKEKEKASFKIPKCSKKSDISPLKISSIPIVKNGKINLNMNAGEIIVLLISN